MRLTLFGFLFSLVSFAGLNSNPELGFFENGGVDFGRDHSLHFYRKGAKTFLSVYRFQTFSPAELNWLVRDEAKSPFAIWIEGPFLNGDAVDQVPVGDGPITKRLRSEGDGELRVSTSLPGPGLYRLIVARPGWLTQNSQPADSERIRFKVDCPHGCARPSLDLYALRQYLQKSNRLEIFRSLMLEVMEEIDIEPELKANWVATLDKLVHLPYGKEWTRFPTLPTPFELSSTQVWIEQLGLQGKQQPEDKPIVGKLSELMRHCDFVRNPEKPVHKSLPEVFYGHFSSEVLTRCQLAQSISLAKILTALSVTEDSVVSLSVGKHLRSVRTPKQLFESLLDSGHSIEVRNERTFANFISFRVGEAETRIPVWIRTGSKSAEGNSFDVPMGHSQITFRIWGPLVNTRVAVYLGSSGAAFFGLTDQRPAWTGYEVEYEANSETRQGRSLVLDSLDAAALYLQRNRLERGNLPADGYGVLGVCNDSTAAVELATRKTVSAFPLMRSLRLNSVAIADGLESVLEKLPKDMAADPTALTKEAYADYLKESRCRALKMYPHRATPHLVWDKPYQSQVKEFLLANPCR